MWDSKPGPVLQARVASGFPNPNAVPHRSGGRSVEFASMGAGSPGWVLTALGAVGFYFHHARPVLGRPLQA